MAAASRAGVDDLRVLDAMRRVPRAAFVPLDQVGLAYHDEPVRIPHDQVTTQPSLSARMVQALRLAGTEHVLEVGTGYGYQTALLAQLASFVTSIERWPDLAEMARRHLAAQEIKNVRVVDGDGTEGEPVGRALRRHRGIGGIPKGPRTARQPAQDRRPLGAADRIRWSGSGDRVRAQCRRPCITRDGVSRQVRAALRPSWFQVKRQDLPGSRSGAREPRSAPASHAIRRCCCIEE